jgi:hypothetical protein
MIFKLLILFPLMALSLAAPQYYYSGPQVVSQPITAGEGYVLQPGYGNGNGVYLQPWNSMGNGGLMYGSPGLPYNSYPVNSGVYVG